MKEQLEELYGELMQLKKEHEDDYMLEYQYEKKMNAIMTLLEPMHYGAPNPITEKK